MPSTLPRDWDPRPGLGLYAVVEPSPSDLFARSSRGPPCRLVDYQTQALGVGAGVRSVDAAIHDHCLEQGQRDELWRELVMGEGVWRCTATHQTRLIREEVVSGRGSIPAKADKRRRPDAWPVPFR
jgi:hypothetical protein